MLLLTLASGAPPARAAEPLVLLVQPPAWRQGDAPIDARPLAALIARVLQVPVSARVSEDALSHWRSVRDPRDHQLAYEEAHFSAWRIRRHGFVALARAAGDVRFAVVVRPGTLVAAPSDLAARRVGVPEPPALAALRLMELFPDAARAPRLVPAASRAAALAALASGPVAAAVIALDDAGPPPEAPVALVTDTSPGRGLSVSASVPEASRRALQRALVGTRDTPDGRRALAALGIAALEPASGAVLEDSERLLRGTWGYR